MHEDSMQPVTFAVMMKIPGCHRLIVMLLLAGSMLMCESCIFGRRESKQVRQADKAVDQMSKENQAEFNKALQHHMDSQSEQTKKQMKKMKRLQKKQNKVRKRSLWDRIFRNKCP
jgi:Flp pilus assembly protein TadB